MDDFNNLSIKVKYYKCFGEEEQGFECIKPINIIIGKNNTGKSALLDMIQFLSKDKQSNDDFRVSKNKSFPNSEPEIILDSILSNNDMEFLFPEEYIRVPNSSNRVKLYQYASGQRIRSKYQYSRKNNISSDMDFVLSYESINGNIDGQKTNIQHIFEPHIRNKRDLFYPIYKKNFFRLSSDRDIVLEGNDFKVIIKPNGLGCTNAFHRFRNGKEFPTKIITESILNDLNCIYEPEIIFDDITILENEEGLWEICLSEKNKKEIEISKSGSGLKTILLVISFIHIIPLIQKSRINLENIIFGFEELENNLHPSIQRNLFNYLRHIAIKHKTIFFITTHSNIVIDFFSKDENAQIIHVTHNNGVSKVKKVISYKDQKEILDDLEVRASDLLQSNCLVWVEGPSDRIYFNKWIELFTNGEIKEGYHYQCVFYGGRLLAALSGEDPDSESNLIKILNINSKAIMIMDSDRKSLKDDINDTKKRVKTEIEKSEGVVWITYGREIENYIPFSAIKQIDYVRNNKEIGRFQKFENYLKTIKAINSNKLYKKSKTAFSSKIQNYLTLEDIDNVLDLNQKMKVVVDKIKIWNGIN